MDYNELERRCALLDAAGVEIYIKGVGSAHRHSVREDNGSIYFYYGGSQRTCYLLDHDMACYARDAQDRIVKITEYRELSTWTTMNSNKRPSPPFKVFT